jgi:hypothetical protein
MKKIIALSTLSLLFLAFFVLPVHASATKLSINPLSTTVGKVGKIFTINVTITGVTDLYGFEFKLDYNTTILDAKTITQGSFLPPLKSYVLVNQINDTGGYVWFAATLLAPEPAKSGNGVLATISFNATYGTIYPQTVGCDLHLYDTILGDPTGQSIAHDTIDGYYAFVPIKGDLNGDGIVNILDLVKLAGKFGKTVPPEDPIYDFNNDTKINILDAIIVAGNFGKTG